MPSFLIYFDFLHSPPHGGGLVHRQARVPALHPPDDAAVLRAVHPADQKNIITPQPVWRMKVCVKRAAFFVMMGV